MGAPSVHQNGGIRFGAVKVNMDQQGWDFVRTVADTKDFECTVRRVLEASNAARTDEETERAQLYHALREGRTALMRRKE